MKNPAVPAPSDGSQPAIITDVRDVPLDRLLDDVCVRQMVSRVIGVSADPSRISVAVFNSAI